MEKELSRFIGLDRIVLTIAEEQMTKTTNGEINVFNIKFENEAITIRPNALNKGLMDISITCPKMFSKTNENNVSVDDLEYLVELIQDELFSKGIDISVGELKLGSFEINVNVNDPKLYDVFELIAKANIHDNLKAFKVENKEGIQSVKVKKSKYTFKTYKKSEHLMEQFETVEEEFIVRFEVSTNVATEKAKILGDEITLNSLIKNWECVEEWFCNCIRLTVKKPIEKYLSDMENQCVARLNQGTKPSVLVNELMFRQDLIDLCVFDNAMKKHYKISGKKKPQSVIKSTHNRLKKLDENRYNQVVNNVKKLEELYSLIGV